MIAKSITQMLAPKLRRKPNEPKRSLVRIEECFWGEYSMQGILDTMSKLAEAELKLSSIKLAPALSDSANFFTATVDVLEPTSEWERRVKSYQKDCDLWEDESLRFAAAQQRYDVWRSYADSPHVLTWQYRETTNGSLALCLESDIYYAPNSKRYGLIRKTNDYYKWVMYDGYDNVVRYGYAQSIDDCRKEVANALLSLNRLSGLDQIDPVITRIVPISKDKLVSYHRLPNNHDYYNGCNGYNG